MEKVTYCQLASLPWLETPYSAIITGHKLNAFYFIFVEETYPHQVAVVYLDDISKQVGRDKYRGLLIDYTYYIDNPNKVNNNSDIQMISLPEYVLRDYENELEDGGIF